MKKYIYQIFTLLIVAIASSCESYQIHGDLDGFWQVASIEDKETGNVTQCKGDTYYSFQRDLVLVSHVLPDRPTGLIKENYIAYFSYNNDSIAMTDFRIYIDKDAPSAPLSKLKKFGLYAIFNTFYVEKLNKSFMILNSEKVRILMKKY